MGKPDTRQPTLSFPSKRNTRQTESESEDTAGGASNTQQEDQGKDMRTILREVRSGFQTINTKLDTLSAQMESVKTQVATYEHCLDVLKNRESDCHDFQVETKKQLTQMDKLLLAISAKNEDLEARSRRNNIRITGVPESTAIDKMETFATVLLTNLFAPHLSPGFAVERAHRTLGPRPQPGATPRPILVRILNYQDRVVVLRQARIMGTTSYQGNKLAFYPDFTPAVQAARKEFMSAKKLLLQAQIPYSLLYPAKLKVSYECNTQFFTDAKSALKFAKHVGGQKHKSKSKEAEGSSQQLSDVE